MIAVVHRSAQRGKASYGWLEISNSFSFADYFDPLRERFGVLRVLNEFILQGGYAIPAHFHANLEILTIPLEGTLSLRVNDSSPVVVKPGQVHLTSAGSGIALSESVPASVTACHFLQLWIFSSAKNLEPGVAQLDFGPVAQRNGLQLIASPGADAYCLKIRQQSWVNWLNLQKGYCFNYLMKHPEHGLMVFVVDGFVKIREDVLEKGDSIELWGAGHLTFEAQEDALMLLTEVPED